MLISSTPVYVVTTQTHPDTVSTFVTCDTRSLLFDYPHLDTAYVKFNSHAVKVD